MKKGAHWRANCVGMVTWSSSYSSGNFPSGHCPSQAMALVLSELGLDLAEQASGQRKGVAWWEKVRRWPRGAWARCLFPCVSYIINRVKGCCWETLEDWGRRKEAISSWNSWGILEGKVGDKDMVFLEAGALIVSLWGVGPGKCIRAFSHHDIIFLSQFRGRADFKERSW